MVAKINRLRRADALQQLAFERMAAAGQPQPPSGALINVILEYADIQQPLGGGRLILRLGARRMKDPVIREILGRETRRLADISVLWDEEEGEIVRVLDTAAPPEPAFGSEDEFCEDDAFELTEAALAYIARHEAGRTKRKA